MRYLVFLGSARESTPPRPARRGARVAIACAAELARRGHDVELVDVLEVPRDPPFKPHFAYAKGRAPAALEGLARDIAGADGYVMVSPEYNHSMSPALMDLLNHIGASHFAYKPSVIATYSAGQWGGARAAVAMRTYLSELGCLPVSAMIHVPKAQEIFAEDGEYAEGVDDLRWRDYLGRAFGQLDWWARAAEAERGRSDGPGAFDRDPSQRNAP